MPRRPHLFQLSCALWARQRPLQVKDWLSDAVCFDAQEQDAILDLLEQDPLLRAIPLEPSYRHKLLKHLVAIAEEQGQGLSEQLCEQMCAQLMQPKGAEDEASGAQWCIKTFVHAPTDDLDDCGAASATAIVSPPSEPLDSRQLGDMQGAAPASVAEGVHLNAVAHGDSKQVYTVPGQVSGGTSNLGGGVTSTLQPGNAEQHVGQQQGSTAAASHGPVCAPPAVPSTRKAPAMPMPTCELSPQLEQALVAHAARVGSALQEGGQISTAADTATVAAAAAAQGSLKGNRSMHLQYHCEKGCELQGQGQVHENGKQQQQQQQQRQPCPYGAVSVQACHNMLAGSTGCAEWEAGLALSEALINHPELVRGATCLELGCGTGLVGIHAARAGAAWVAMTDGDSEAAQNCAWNCRINGVRLSDVPLGTNVQDAAVKELNNGQGLNCTSNSELGHGATCTVGVCCWSTEVALLSGAKRQMPSDSSALKLMGGRFPEVILGSDLIYDPEVVPVLVQLIKNLLLGAQAARSGKTENDQRGQKQTSGLGNCHEFVSMPQKPAAVAYLCSTRRNPKTTALFEACVIRAGLSLEDASHSLTSVGAGPASARFQCVSSLEAARQRILLQAITLPDDGWQAS